MCILGVPQIRAGAEPERYILSYSISLKMVFCFNLRKKLCSEALASFLMIYNLGNKNE